MVFWSGLHSSNADYNTQDKATGYRQDWGCCMCFYTRHQSVPNGRISDAETRLPCISVALIFAVVGFVFMRGEGTEAVR